MLVVAVCIALSGLSGPDVLARQTSQGAGQAPVFRSTTALVTVDAIITDKDGNFATGLEAGDLQLLEDGKPQRIEQFYMVTHDMALRGDVPGELTGNTQRADHRLFIIMFDEAHLAHESLLRAKHGAEQFVTTFMGAGDVGGVFLNGGMFKGRLTTDRGELLEAIRAVRPGNENRQELLAPFREWPMIPSEHDAARIADGAREVTDALGVKACTESPADCQAAGGLQQVENQIQQKSRLYIRQARMLTARTIQNLQIVTRGLSRFPGRKTVMFLSEGFFVEDTRTTVEMAAAQAARAGTTIYTIDGRGLTNGTSPNPDVVRAGRARATTFDSGDDGPNILTAGTGGFMVRNVDDISRAFGMIVRDTSTYYVIGYQPDNATMDGKFRKIEVKSKISGLKVRARKGYAALVLPPQEVMWK